MEDHLVAWVFTGIIAWGSIFLLLRMVLPKRFTHDFCARLVSSGHAVLMVCLVLLSVEDWRCPLCPLSAPPSTLQRKILAVTLSHMIYDLVCCFFYENKIQWDSYVHHFVSIVGIGTALFYNTCGSEVVAALWITEVSTPFLQMRDMLKDMGWRDTKLNMINDILFALIFSMARMVVGPYITYVLVRGDNPLLIKSMASGLLLVSAYWFYKIAKMMSYKVRKWSSPTSKPRKQEAE